MSGGALIPQFVLDDMVNRCRSDNLSRLFVPALPPLTRRQRIRARLFDWRYRVALAIEALRGRHECGYE